jgi:hypothetical protein
MLQRFHATLDDARDLLLAVAASTYVLAFLAAIQFALAKLIYY